MMDRLSAAFVLIRGGYYRRRLRRDVWRRRSGSMLQQRDCCDVIARALRRHNGVHDG